MEQTPTTAEEFWYKNTGQSINQEEYSAMIEFTKLHVEAALKAAVKHLPYDDKMNQSLLDERAILNSYPIDNIK